MYSGLNWELEACEMKKRGSFDLFVCSSKRSSEKGKYFVALEYFISKI